MNEFSITTGNVKKLANSHGLTASEVKFQSVLERFVHFQLTKLFHEIGGRGKFINSFLVVLPEDFFMSDIHEEHAIQNHLAHELSTEFATIEILNVSVDDFFQPSIKLGISIEPYTESVWKCLYIELTSSPDEFHVNRIDFGDDTLVPDEAQWYELTDLLQDYLVSERGSWQYS